MKLCQDAGVRVMVITGDSKDTATAIARDVNIFGPEEVCRHVLLFLAQQFCCRGFYVESFFGKSKVNYFNLSPSVSLCVSNTTTKTNNFLFCRVRRTLPRELGSEPISSGSPRRSRRLC